MAQILELAHLVDQHGMAQVQVRRGRVEARLDAQRSAGREFVGHFLLHDQLFTTPTNDREAFRH